MNKTDSNIDSLILCKQTNLIKDEENSKPYSFCILEDIFLSSWLENNLNIFVLSYWILFFILERFKDLVKQSNCFDEYVSHDKKIIKIMQKNVDFKLEDFEVLVELGRGASGKVFKVKHKESGKFYAMKVNLNWLIGKNRERVQKNSII